MKNFYREIVFGAILFFLFSTFIAWLILSEPRSPLPIGIAILILIIGVFSFAGQMMKKNRDTKSGEPAEDEFTKMAKVHAGNHAFLYSMYLWLLIFVFNSSFIKNETMLGIGILGSAFIYGVSLWYFKISGNFNA